MRAVWRAARAAVRRRRLQTLVIALVTLTSSTALVFALGLLDAASAPFDKAFGAQRGPHMVAVLDPEKVTDERLARVGDHPGVEAMAICTERPRPRNRRTASVRNASSPPKR